MDGGKGVVRGPSKNRVQKPNCSTLAARWNRKIFRGLEVALSKDPEADLAASLGSNYSEQLQSNKTYDIRRPGKFPNRDIRSRLSTTELSTVIFELSTEVKNLLPIENENLSEAIVGLLDKSVVLYEGPWAASVMVFQVSGGKIVIKIANERSVINEHRSLSYLQQHLPAFPAPRPHGLVRLGNFCLLFTTFVPGLTLEQAWPQLDNAQKRSISGQLDTLFSSLRKLAFPANTPLGGVQGGGCSDSRRGVRVASEPIMDTKQFEDFIFDGSIRATPVYIKLLRDLMPPPAKCVFTHGDVRPANIMVDKDEDGTWGIISIIDWEASGFYPEYWESVKMTNNLTPLERDDWYMYLPESFSQHQYPIQWLVDMLWDRSLSNS
ncbi:Protein kinase-like domain containing protein [Rhypophila sp. PSN 637]